jgi:cell division protein FtsN
MSPKIEDDSEILLGNKQLLLVFGVVAVLLAVAFTGGYMVGKNSGEKKPAAALTADSPGGTDTGGPATHTVPALGTTPDASERPASGTVAVVAPSETIQDPEAPPLGSKKSKAPPVVVAEKTVPVPLPSSTFTPEAGQTFLQVAAVGKDEADAVADVLHKKGFRAHSVPKPGSTKLYRVLIGPLKDAGDLANTRDALRKTGFREVITQRY